MSIDLTGIAAATIAGVFSILAIVLPLIITARMKDAQAAVVLGNAVKNSLGALQQAADATVRALKPAVTIPGVPLSLTPGVQYVLDHAGEEAARFGITPQAIAAKISAQIGLANIATNIATAASPAPTPRPLEPVPEAGSPAIPLRGVI